MSEGSIVHLLAKHHRCIVSHCVATLKWCKESSERDKSHLSIFYSARFAGESVLTSLVNASLPHQQSGLTWNNVRFVTEQTSCAATQWCIGLLKVILSLSQQFRENLKNKMALCYFP